MRVTEAETNKRWFERQHFIQQLQDHSITWDVIVIGGGATGLGIAVDAASRGYKTLLLEQADFAKGTSSRSTKLVHGGVRYLAQGDIRLVYEALHERGLLLQNAPHLVHKQAFIIPSYTWWSQLFYGLGLKVYDWMAGRYRLEKTSFLSASEVAKRLPAIERNSLKGGIAYYDGQFDDARLAINLAQTCAAQGGTLLNYTQVQDLLKNDAGKVTGVKARDLESGEVYRLQASVVINATGVFVDEVLQMDVPAHEPLVRPSQGVHVVLDGSFLPGTAALMIPSTPDGRVLFAVPWHGYVLLGTTDTPLEAHSLEPIALEEEITFILQTAGQYLHLKPTRQDVRSVFAGLRPLAASGKNTGSTKEISRSHKLMVTPSGLITITGGKWTTYRKMAEDTLALAITSGALPASVCRTAALKIHGYAEDGSITDPLHFYGSDAPAIRSLVKNYPELGEKLHPEFPDIAAQVVWAVQNEMARTVEDVLARRLRILFLNASVAIEMAPKVAAIMAAALGQNEVWQQNQVATFTALANRYLLKPLTAAATVTQTKGPPP